MKSRIQFDPVSAAEQALEAYRQLRYSLVKFAEAEAELVDRAAEGKLTPTLESILVSRAHAWRDRAIMFAAVYHVERDVAQRYRR